MTRRRDSVVEGLERDEGRRPHALSSGSASRVTTARVALGLLAAIALVSSAALAFVGIGRDVSATLTPGAVVVLCVLSVSLSLTAALSLRREDGIVTIVTLTTLMAGLLANRSSPVVTAALTFSALVLAIGGVKANLRSPAKSLAGVMSLGALCVMVGLTLTVVGAAAAEFDAANEARSVRTYRSEHGDRMAIVEAYRPGAMASDRYRVFVERTFCGFVRKRVLLRDGVGSAPRVRWLGDRRLELDGHTLETP
jgi:hypothetical protein